MRCIYAKDCKDGRHPYWICELSETVCAVSRYCIEEQRVLHTDVRGCKFFDGDQKRKDKTDNS